MVTFVVAPVSRHDAMFAVVNWHYAKREPLGRLVCFGLWEAGSYRGARVFGRGAKNIGTFLGLDQTQCCELVRVAFRSHETPVSQALAVALKLIKVTSPGVQAVVSYADMGQGHYGAIYQATNWVYLGAARSPASWIIHGRPIHNRTVAGLRSGINRAHGGIKDPSVLAFVQKHMDRNAKMIEGSVKHKYAYGLSRQASKRLDVLSLPYPKRSSCGGSVEGDTPAILAGEAGSIPARRSI